MLQPVPPPPGTGYVIPDEPYVPAPIPAELMKRKAEEEKLVETETRRSAIAPTMVETLSCTAIAKPHPQFHVEKRLLPKQ